MISTQEYLSFDMTEKLKFEKAAEQTCNCLSINNGKKVVIVTDLSKEFFAKELANKILGKGASLSYFVMEHYGKRPYKLPEIIFDGFKNADSGIMIFEPLKGELELFRQPIYELPSKTKKLRLATMPGITEQILEEGMACDFSKIEKFSKIIYDLAVQTKEIKVTTKAGTNLKTLVGKYKWIMSTGIISPEIWGNIPSGEVYTTPDSIEGEVVVDGVVGGYIEKVCKNHPVKMKIKENKIISVYCENKDLEKKVLETINEDENASRIGEVALGTNIFIKHLIGNTLQDEKSPGFHFANGDPLGEDTGAEWNSKTHTDYILLKPTIYFDKKIVMDNGKYLDKILEKIEK